MFSKILHRFNENSAVFLGSEYLYKQNEVNVLNYIHIITYHIQCECKSGF